MNDMINENTRNDTGIPATRPGRTATISIAAGLLAGGTIGLFAVAPSLTNAAPDDSGEQVVDVPADDTTDDTTEMGGRLRATLQPLVDDGTISESQADAVTDHLVQNRPERDGERLGRRGPHGHGPGPTVLADALGIDVETLRTELAAGNSIADIAEANGADVQAVIDALIADAESHLDLAVEHGLDEELAATRLERITERIEERVYDTRDARDIREADTEG